MRRLSPAFLIVCFAASIQAQSTSSNAADPKTAAFTQRLLSAIGHRDVDALAAMFKFPAAVHAGAVTLPIANSAALAKAFDTVFTPELGCALERGQRNAVQLQPSGDSFLITRIDEPAGAAPAAPRPQPRHVDVPSSQVQFAGTLAVGGADRYVITGRQGDVLQARIERFQGRAIGVRVVDVKTGKVLSNGLDTARVVSATVQQPGDIAVDVTRMTFCEPNVSYVLTLTKHR